MFCWWIMKGAECSDKVAIDGICDQPLTFCSLCHINLQYNKIHNSTDSVPFKGIRDGCMVEPMMGVGNGKVSGSLLEVVQKLVVDMLVEGGVDQSLSVVLVERKVDKKFSIVLGTVDICCSVVTVVDERHGSSIGFLNGGWQQQIGCANGVQIYLGSEQLNTVVKWMLSEL